MVSTSFAESSLPFFPGLSFLLLNSNHNSSSTSDTTVAAEQQQLDALIQTRHALQDWLSALLMHSHAHTIPSVSSFLTLGANMIPTQYERVVWTQFSPSPVHTINSSANLSLSSLNSNNNNTNPGVNFDDMEMDDMFLGEDEIGSAPHHDDHHPHQTDFDEASFIPAASIRYKPTDEAFTDEEEMEILNLAAAGEVEMIEDIGTLVQSLGASHLGRSLQLQAEMKFPNYKSPYTSNVTAIQSSAHHQQPGQQQQPLPGGGGLLAAKLQQQQGGVSIGGSRAPDAPPSVGGLGGAMERAAFHNNNVAAATAAHFNHKPPVSAPRLDSFKMIKVIGKGSFG